MANKNDLILIVGGGPAGLGAALAFNNNDYKNIVVLEGMPSIEVSPEDSYPVGLNVRGQTSVKHLFGKSKHLPDVSTMGLRVDQWKIIVGPNINVANFFSGHLIGTNRADVVQMLYEETQRRDSAIKILFGYEAKDLDAGNRVVRCESKSGEKKEFQPACLVIADGYRSKLRDKLAERDSSFKIQQWPWNTGFRVLFSEKEPKTELNPYIHYIQNQIYISKLLDGRWTAGISIRDDSPKFLSSKDMTDENVAELKKYLRKMAPPAATLFTDEECRSFFSRRIFTGSVTKVNKLVLEDGWALLLGDAAHSAIPATGEGINSALEDCLVLQQALETNKPIAECFTDFENNRIEDVNALSDMAYSLARPVFKNYLQRTILGLFKCAVGPTKEDLLFGKNSTDIKKYSDVVKIWHSQTKLLGGPNLPPENKN